MSAEPQEKRTKMSAKLGYWNIRGLAQPIRLLLAYTGTEFEDIRYQQGDAPNFSLEEWTSVKFTLGLDFPNLPYYIEGDFKLTQSNAILRYIAGKHNLCGKTDREKATVDMLECEAYDFRNGWVGLCYNPNMDSHREGYLKKVELKIKQFSDYLGDKPWFTGDEITHVDFVLYELLDQHQLHEPTILKEHPNLEAFLKRFEAIPVIQAYMKSEKFIKRPVNNNTARWK